MRKEWYSDPDGRRPCEDEDRDWNDAAVSQGTLRNTSNHRRSEQAKKDSSLVLLREHGPADNLIWDFKAQEERENKLLSF